MSVSVRFVHASDLHLDSPLRGLARYEGAPVEAIRGATRLALEQIVELCIGEDAQLLLIAGDVYDGDWKDYSTGLFFAGQMSRLRNAGIRVVMLRGNHDASSQITRHLRLPDNVVELSTKKPVTHVFEDIGVAVHGQGFATRVVDQDLAANYPAAVAGLFNIGLLHTSVSGRPGHEPYAPCSIETLKNLAYDYFALGHVHQREVLSEKPWVVFSGNPQGRHMAETGAKGVTLVQTEEQRVISVEHRDTDVVRFEQLKVEVSSVRAAEEVPERVLLALEEVSAAAQGRTVAVRLILSGRTVAHGALTSDPQRWEQELRSVANDVGGDGLWIEKISFRTQGQYDRERLAQRDDAIGQLVRSLTSLHSDEQRLDSLLQEFTSLRLPAEVREMASISTPDDLRAVLGDVQEMLLARLLDHAEDA